MKPEIHPKYELASIQCACGATFQVRSTKAIRKLEICSACHPFFSGKNRLMDIAGRVDKFNQRYKKFMPAAAPVEAAPAEATPAE